MTSSRTVLASSISKCIPSILGNHTDKKVYFDNIQKKYILSRLYHVLIPAKRRGISTITKIFESSKAWSFHTDRKLKIKEKIQKPTNTSVFVPTFRDSFSELWNPNTDHALQKRKFFYPFTHFLGMMKSALLEVVPGHCNAFSDSKTQVTCCLIGCLWKHNIWPIQHWGIPPHWIHSRCCYSPIDSTSKAYNNFQETI